MAYTTINDPSAYFQTTLYTGTGSTQSITGVGFQPDLLWIRNRFNSARTARAIDSVRGVGKLLNIAGTADEDTQADTVTSFDSDGFSLGADSSEYGVNDNTGSHVAWSWKAGTSFTNDASATGIGTIDSTGSVNDTAGFSIVSWTGTLANGTVKHGLSTAPKMILIKCRGTGSRSWVVYHDSIGNTHHLTLNETDASADSDASFNDTSPTTSVFSLGSSNNANDSATMIAYCFAEKQGYSKFGSYTGNGNADGTFVYLGFKPAWVLVKKTSGTGNWMIIDNKRSASGGFNVLGERLKANASDAGSTADYQDHLSNGFKIRTTASSWNDSGGTYIYMAFAENPFVTSTGVPATAR